MAGGPTGLRVLQVLRAPVGGLFRHVADLTEGLAARGHAVGIVMDAASAGSHWEARIADLAPRCTLGVTRIAMARGPALGDAGAIAHVRGRLKNERIAIVHGHGAKGGAYARLAALGLASNVARAYTPHGGSLHFAPGSLEGRIYHGLERALAPVTDALLFESDFARARFAHLIAPERPGWFTVPNGVAAPEFAPIPIAESATDLVFVGEMRALKGVDVLIEALAGLPGVTATLVGSGPEAATFQGLADRLGLATRVAFHPPMPARAAFALGRLVVVPSRAESLPYLVLEAGAAGRPLLASAVGGIPEIVGPDADALVAPGQVADWQAALAAALAAPAELEARAARVRDRIARNYSVEAMVGAIEQVYCSISIQRPRSVA